jgi:hypothetical protein
MHSVTVNRDRPDFRVFIDLLYGANWNVDTDGNSFPVSSRTWTRLYIADRQDSSTHVVIAERDDGSMVFSVESKSERLEELAAIYLYLYAGTAIAKDVVPLSVDQVASLKMRFASEIARAERARWHRSSAENPYPQPD